MERSLICNRLDKYAVCIGSALLCCLVWLQNKKKLLGMGMNEDTVELFLSNPVFSPALSTVLTTALDSMTGVENRELFLKVALQANEPPLPGSLPRFP
jgi:hypothetical protein